jgi:hypothetical protein
MRDLQQEIELESSGIAYDTLAFVNQPEDQSANDR